MATFLSFFVFRFDVFGLGEVNLSLAASVSKTRFGICKFVIGCDRVLALAARWGRRDE
jgi:hypothetical protein